MKHRSAVVTHARLSRISHVVLDARIMDNKWTDAQKEDWRLLSELLTWMRNQTVDMQSGEATLFALPTLTPDEEERLLDQAHGILRTR